MNLNCICKRLDQNNITGSLNLTNINISGPLKLINLTGNNMGPDFTSFLLYSNISKLVSNGLSIMWVPFCNMHLTFHFIERYPINIYVHYLVAYIINYIHYFKLFVVPLWNKYVTKFYHNWTNGAYWQAWKQPLLWQHLEKWKV